MANADISLLAQEDLQRLDEHYRTKLWLLHLMLPIPGRLGKVLSALLIMAVVWIVLEALGGILVFYEQVFFSTLVGYSIAILARIVEQSEKAVDDLQRLTGATDAGTEPLRRAMSRHSRKEQVYTIASALFFGTLHTLLIRTLDGDGLDNIVFDTELYVTYLGTMLAWLVMTSVITALITNAVIWSRLGRHLEIDLLRPAAACIMGRVAVLSTLAIMGAQVLFVFLILEHGWDWASVFPGLAASFLPTLALFFIPVWPLHKRLEAAREEALFRLDRSIGDLGRLEDLDLGDAAKLEQRNRLLVLRREIQDTSAWPFDTSNLFKIIIYLLLPPMTWVGAALVESVVGTIVE